MYSQKMLLAIIGLVCFLGLCMFGCDDEMELDNPEDSIYINVDDKEMKSFYVVDFEAATEGGCLDEDSTEYVSIDTYLVKETETAYFWIEDGQHTFENVAILDAIAETFDTDIYGNVTTNFAALSDIDGNGKIHIVFIWLPGEMSSMVGGFFDPVQMFNYAESNKGEVIYVNLGIQGQFEMTENQDTGEYDMDEVLLDSIGGTVAHELQHACNFAQNYVREQSLNPLDYSDINSIMGIFEGQEVDDLWMNEGMSMMAMYLYEGGYGLTLQNYWIMYDLGLDWQTMAALFGLDTSTPSECEDPSPSISIRNGYPLLPFWNKMEDYTLVTMFFLYLSFQSDCSDLYKQIVQHEEESTAAVLAAAEACGAIESGTTFKDLLGNWLLANLFLKVNPSATTGEYSYEGNIYNAWWMLGMQGPQTSTQVDTVELYPGGAIYLPVKPDMPFEPIDPPANIAYVGYDQETKVLDFDSTGGYEGDILLVYNYDVDPANDPITAPIPSSDAIRDTSGELQGGSSLPEKQPFPILIPYHPHY